MKTKNITIIILVAVLLGQFYLLFRQTRIQRYMECVSRKGRPMEVYVAGITESINHNYKVKTELLFQFKWAMRHLGQCIELLEKERGLEPIQIKRKHYPSPDSNRPGLLPPTKKGLGPFYVPYEKHEIPDLTKYPEEIDLRRLQCMLNMNTVAIASAIYTTEEKICNYEERLQRLDPNR